MVSAAALIDWLLEGDPAIRWQVLRDLTDASADDVAAERARVEHDGWGAGLLALERPQGGHRAEASIGSVLAASSAIFRTDSTPSAC